MFVNTRELKEANKTVYTNENSLRYGYTPENSFPFLDHYNLQNNVCLCYCQIFISEHILCAKKGAKCWEYIGTWNRDENAG